MTVSRADQDGRCLVIMPFGSHKTRLASVIKLAKSASRSRADYALDELTEAVRMLPTADNSFTERLVTWRLRQVRAQVRELQEGMWRVEARVPAVHVGYVFGEIVRQMGKGDEYFTITNLSFWTDSQMGGVGFLDQNIQAARRGAQVRHLGHFALIRRPRTDSVQEHFDRVLILPNHAGPKSGGAMTGLDVKLSTTLKSDSELEIQRYETRFTSAAARAFPLKSIEDFDRCIKESQPSRHGSGRGRRRMPRRQRRRLARA